MLTDVEIAQRTKIKPITEIAQKLNLKEADFDLYGQYKAKLNHHSQGKKGKLILVTAMNPTKFGEGKTTVSIGLADALSHVGKSCCLTLREPSLGPVFGIKGGACGGGYAQVAPMEDINLHFTGDFHAITSANNLLSALIDNHIKQGNSLGIAQVIWPRCIDINDRALRKIKIALGGDINGTPRNDNFVITAASEVMAILCLATSINDLKQRLSNIIIGYGISEEEITVRDLKAENAMAILLKDALKPNLVQTLEGTPALIHGGPFANIAHGCNSIIATNTALSNAEYTITEAGFGAELGGEKFINIKCRLANLNPACAVLVVTVRSIKHNAGIEDNELDKADLHTLKEGFENIKVHIKNLTQEFNLEVIVAINKFETDTTEEITFLKELCQQVNIPAVITDCYKKGGQGAISLAEQVVALCDKSKTQQINYTYDLHDSLEKKIAKVAKNIYGAGTVIFSDDAQHQLSRIQKDYRYASFPICIAKTQYSLSADASLLGAPRGFEFVVKNLQVRAGAGFILVECGNILLMPGLPYTPNANKMNINKKGEISGLS